MEREDDERKLIKTVLSCSKDMVAVKTLSVFFVNNGERDDRSHCHCVAQCEACMQTRRSLSLEIIMNT